MQHCWTVWKKSSKWNCQDWHAKKVLFHQDNVPPYKSTIVVAKSGFHMIPHLPYSSNLALCNFFQFPNLKIWLDGKQFSSNEYINCNLVFCSLWDKLRRRDGKVGNPLTKCPLEETTLRNNTDFSPKKDSVYLSFFFFVTLFIKRPFNINTGITDATIMLM